jgi:hypothetical protein
MNVDEDKRDLISWPLDFYKNKTSMAATQEKQIE